MFLIIQAKCYTIVLNSRFVRIHIPTHIPENRDSRRKPLCCYKYKTLSVFTLIPKATLGSRGEIGKNNKMPDSEYTLENTRNESNYNFIMKLWRLNDEALYSQIGEVSHSQALVLFSGTTQEGINNPGDSWMCLWKLPSPNVEGANEGRPYTGPRSHQQGGAGWDCEIVELKILRTVGSMHSKLTTLAWLQANRLWHLRGCDQYNTMG